MPVLKPFFTRSIPVFLRALVIGVLVEAIGLAVSALILLGELLMGAFLSLGMSLFLVVFLCGVASVLVISGRALLAGRRTGRGPVVTWQLFQIIGSVAVIGSGRGLVVLGGWVSLVIAVVVIVLIMMPSVVAVTASSSDV